MEMNKETKSPNDALCSKRQQEHLAVTQSLEHKPTRNDADNILHCLFGEVDSFGFTVCRDTKKYRIRLSEFVKQTVISVVKNRKSTSTRIQSILRSAVEKFVLFGSHFGNEEQYPKAIEASKKRLEDKSAETLLTNLLKPENRALLEFLFHQPSTSNVPSSVEEMKIILSQLGLANWYEDLVEIIDEIGELKMESWNIANKSPRKFDWEDIVFSKDQSLVDEYCKFIASPREQLGKPELELLAFAYCIRISVFREDSDDHKKQKTNTAQLKLVEKIIPDCCIKSERFILMCYDQVDDDTIKYYWKRLNLDKALKEKMETFYKERSDIGRACKLLSDKKMIDNIIVSTNDPFQSLIQLLKK